MFGDAKFKREVLLGLSRALADEDAHLRKYSRLTNIVVFSGAVLIVIAAMLAQNGFSVVWVIAASAAGGILIGLSIFFSSAVRQWPVVRRFIDVKAVQEAAARNEEP